LSLSPKPYPHKCAEAGARTRGLPVTRDLLDALFKGDLKKDMQCSSLLSLI